MNTVVEELKSALAALALRPPASAPASDVRGETGAQPGQVQGAGPQARGCQFDVTVSPDAVVAAAELADRFGFAIDTITGVDWIEKGEMEVIYDFFHPRYGLHLVVRARVPRDNPALPTIQGVFPGANWHERETHDFFGIQFVGHPDLTPLLLPEDADYHPLRKDFQNAGSAAN